MEQTIDTKQQFWQAIAAQPFTGYHFDRHVLIEPFIVDFACVKNKVIVEVDDAALANQNQSLHHRTEYLKNQGYEVIRCRDDEVIENLQLVLAQIKKKLQHH